MKKALPSTVPDTLRYGAGITPIRSFLPTGQVGFYFTLCNKSFLSWTEICH